MKGTSTSLLRTVTPACKNIPYTGEAASKARTKLFPKWYSLGPRAVFFTISSGDECSFRITLFVHHEVYEEEEEDRLY
jgi:hypothetical protein